MAHAVALLQVDLLDDLFRRAGEADEPEDQNFVRCACLCQHVASYLRWFPCRPCHAMLHLHFGQMPFARDRDLAHPLTFHRSAQLTRVCSTRQHGRAHSVPGACRKHVREMGSRGLENPHARLFSNPAGDYGRCVCFCSLSISCCMSSVIAGCAGCSCAINPAVAACSLPAAGCMHQSWMGQHGHESHPGPVPWTCGVNPCKQHGSLSPCPEACAVRSMVNERVGSSQWEQSSELGDTWASRNAFSYGR